jgi:SNF2 family DNA or RNA helicase
LRRTQEGEAKKNPRCALPPLNTSVVKLKFQYPHEQDTYSNIYDTLSQASMQKERKHNDIIEGIMRCRQACVHPALIQDGLSRKLQRTQKNEPFTKYKKKVCVNYDARSTKIDFLCNDIQQNIISKRCGDKCLIFCTWLLEMKIINKELSKRNISSLIYDGGLSQAAKENVLYNFSNSSINVLILQINCGSTGLNLQCASKVYITSPNWNPCIELQAIGRAYRKGQVKSVSCVRLCIEGTMDERCLLVQKNKMDIIKTIINDDTFDTRLGCSNVDLSHDDMDFLLNE